MNMGEQKEQYVRMNIRVPTDVRDWLYEASFNMSTPDKRVSATAYLVDLIRKDRDGIRG